MQAANPLSEAGMSQPSALSSSQYAPNQAQTGGSVNISVALLGFGALAILLSLHLMGFRFAFDVSVGRR